MSKLLREDVKDVDSLISFIDDKIIKLRTSKLIKPHILKEIHSIYLDIVLPWIKEHSSLEEENDRTEEQVIDALLELINYLNKLK